LGFFGGSFFSWDHWTTPTFCRFGWGLGFFPKTQAQTFSNQTAPSFNWLGFFVPRGRGLVKGGGSYSPNPPFHPPTPRQFFPSVLFNFFWRGSPIFQPPFVCFGPTWFFSGVPFWFFSLTHIVCRGFSFPRKHLKFFLGCCGVVGVDFSPISNPFSRLGFVPNPQKKPRLSPFFFFARLARLETNTKFFWAFCLLGGSLGPFLEQSGGPWSQNGGNLSGPANRLGEGFFFCFFFCVSPTLPEKLHFFVGMLPTSL